ncbi:MAG: LLM class F420-dependent oxidoreductase [Actinomycetia bacterium]|nr:LLM class F420-dependent oxidoreductase [Actinomycetes bacterium]
MKFGIIFANTGPFTQPDLALEFACAAEAAGFESLWTVEHVVVPKGYESKYPYDPSGKMPGGETSPIPDPLIWLSYLAAATSRIKLATGVMILPQRNPIVFAKEVATLDQLSAGRVQLGVGVGWLKEEFDAIGVSFNDRGMRTDEHVAAMRALWTEDAASFHGDFVDFDDCISLPHPMQASVPIHIGGHSDVAAKRAGRIGDGFFPAAPTHEELDHLFKLARRTAAENGRDPDALEMTTGGRGAVGPNALAEVQALADLGAHRVVVPAFLFFRDTANALAAYGEAVIAQSS